MDRTPAGLEPNSCADGSLFCGQNARVAENCPPVKGKMHGGFTAALDMRPVSRLYCGQGVGDATPGIIHILPCFAPRYRLYTKYWIDSGQGTIFTSSASGALFCPFVKLSASRVPCIKRRCLNSAVFAVLRQRLLHVRGSKKCNVFL